MQAYVAELLLSISHSWAQMLLLTLSSHVSHPFSSTHKPYQVMSELAGSCCTQKQDGALELYKKAKFKDSWLKVSCFIFFFRERKNITFHCFNSSLTDVGKRSYRCRYRMHAYNNNAWDKGTLRLISAFSLLELSGRKENKMKVWFVANLSFDDETLTVKQ